MKTLISGATGYLGSFLASELLDQGNQVYSLTRSPHPLLADKKKFYEIPYPKQLGSDFLDRLTREIEPDSIIHAAALGSPALCERESVEALRFNAQFSSVWARAASKLGVFFSFISTDLVFEAYQEAPEGGFVETDIPKSYSVYADSKIKAEDIIGSLDNTAIIRTALILGPPVGGKRGALGWLSKALREGVSLPLFQDEWRTPVYVTDLAKFLAVLAKTKQSGVYHAAGPEKLSRLEIGCKFAEALDLSVDSIQENSRLDFKGQPPRAPDVALNAGKAEQGFDFKFRAFSEALALDKEKFQ